MTSQSKSLSQKLERVQNSIQQLPTAAASLNAATDQLGKSVGELDGVLRKFSLGIPTWVPFSSSPNSLFPRYYHEDIGYAKIGGKWGVAIRTVDGDEVSDAGDDIEQWLFSDSPRLLRVRAIEKIPELLEALLKNAAEMTEKITAKAEEVAALTAAINSAIDPRQKRDTVGGILDELRTSLANDSPDKRVNAITAMIAHPIAKPSGKP
jgi:cell division septum initiation protein DivIVA